MLGRNAAHTVVVRPERVEIAPAPATPSGRIHGTISSVTFLGLDTLYEVAIAPDAKLRARIRDARETFRKGDTVVVDWPDDFERELVN